MYEMLLSPIEIRGKTIKNRIVQTAHLTLFSENGVFSDRYINYIKERAKGGVGLIICEAQPVHQSALQFPEMAYAFKPEIVDSYKKVSSACHEYGTTVLAQLWHSSAHATSYLTRQPLLAPGPYMSYMNAYVIREIPKVMDKDDIKELVESFRQAAIYAKEGGMDGVEINAAHSYLVAQFLSPLYNTRTDEYGGSLENRMRFLMEILQAVRDAVGDDFIICVRISVDELVEGGLTLTETRKIAKILDESGLVDIISTSVGIYLTAFMIFPTMQIPQGYQLSTTREIKKEVDKMKVIVVGRIKTPQMAEDILKNGWADFVAMTRALIADPYIPRKIEEGRIEDIRPCIACNQACVSRVAMGIRMSCILNPEVGEEGEIQITSAKEKKKFVVVGGGPAGMEAARVLAEMGHEVVLFEQRNKLGGRVLLAARLPMREEIKEIVEWQARQIQKLGVDVRLGVKADAETVLNENPDAVIIATGAIPEKSLYSPGRPAYHKIPGEDKPHVYSLVDVLEKDPDLGKNVVVMDEEGIYRGMGIADYISNKGCKVTLVTSLHVAGFSTFRTMDGGLLYLRLISKGVDLRTFTVISEVKDKSVVLFNFFRPIPEEIPADAVVVVPGLRANDDLYNALKDKVKTYRIGDCVAPRTIEHAIHEGYKVALEAGGE
jgi:mycofactocin system FadH/OYE family oxidoreductase 2